MTELNGVPVHVSRFVLRDSVIYSSDIFPGTMSLIMHPLTWITASSKTYDEELERIMAWLVQDAIDKFDRAMKELFTNA